MRTGLCRLTCAPSLGLAVVNSFPGFSGLNGDEDAVPEKTSETFSLGKALGIDTAPHLPAQDLT